MARFLKGDIVLVAFPFFGEEAYKHRPALILASWAYFGGTDYLICVMTTQPADDPYLTEIGANDTLGQSLTQWCFLRSTYLFAPDEPLISRKLDRLKLEKWQETIQTVVTVLTE